MSSRSPRRPATGRSGLPDTLREPEGARRWLVACQMFEEGASKAAVSTELYDSKGVIERTVRRLRLIVEGQEHPSPDVLRVAQAALAAYDSARERSAGARGWISPETADELVAILEGRKNGKGGEKQT